MKKSKGHICFNGGFEFYERTGEVFRAPLHTGNVFDSGYRIGRWECSRTHFERFRNVILIQEEGGV